MVQSAVDIQPELVISVSDMCFSYPGKARKAVLNIPSWQVLAGQQLFLQGASGSGKSTLLNLLTGILKPDTGCIRLLNRDLGTLSGHKRDRFRAQHIGVVFQQFNLIPYLSVEDNIRLAAHFGATREKLTASKITNLLEQLHMPRTLLTQRADSLSVGQQQRVAIARALINTPEILVVDEPTSALDAAARDAFITLLLQVSRSNNSTLLFVSHDKNLAHHFDEVVSLAKLNKVASDVA